MQEKNTISTSPAVSEKNPPMSITRDEVERLIGDAKEDMIRKASEKIDLQIQKTQDSFLTIFGIFGSVLALLTIEFQFFKEKLPILHVAGLTLVLFSLLLSFVLALDYVIASRFQQKSLARILLSVLVIGAFGFGFTCLHLGR
jgi:hypothetical protein